MALPTVKDLESSLKNLLRNWDTFGRNLPGIDHTEISRIKYNKRDDVESQKVALYEKWLEVCPNASWDDVINALREADENTLAQTIENKLSSADMALSPKQLPIENETAPSSALSANPVQQGEVYNVPESVVDELKELHDTFVPLAMDVKNEIESKVKQGQVTIDSLMDRVEEERAFSIEPCTTQDSRGFFKSIRPHYNFLNPYLLVVLAIQFLRPSNTAQRAEEYNEKITTFNKSISVRSLVNTLRHYRDHLRPTTNNKIVSIRINSCFNQKLTIWVVQTLIQTLFPIMHHSELPWYEIGLGSLVLSFIATDNMLLPFIVSCARKMEFMRLLGIVSVSIGNVYMVVNSHTKLFSLENSLIEATASGNVEAVKFLLEHLQVNANVKGNEEHSFSNQIDQHDNYLLGCLKAYAITFTDLILDIKEDAEKHTIEGDENSDVAQVINSYYEQLQRQHNFLNTALLSRQSSYLSKDLQQRIKQYCEGVEEIKRASRLSELANELQEHIPDSQPNEGYICVTLTLLGEWILSSMWYVEQLIELVFPSVPFEHFQWFRINHHPEFKANECHSYVFLVPHNLKQVLIESFELDETLAHLLGIYMIKIDCKKAFEGLDVYLRSLSLYSFDTALEDAKHYGNQQSY